MSTVAVLNSDSDDRRHLRAFVRDEETRKAVDQVIAGLMLPNATVQRGGIKDAVRELGRQRSPRILLVDITDADLPLSAVNELAEVCEPGVAVIAIGDRNDVGLFRELVSHGVTDYLVKPITVGLLQKSFSLLEDNAGSSRQTSRLGRLIAVTGTRGGVGSTLVACNIAWCIAQRRQRRVALVDLDLQFGNAALTLDLEPSHGLRDALEHSNRIDALFIDRSMIKKSDTLFVLSGEESLSESILIDYAAIDVMLRELRSKFHFVIVDLPRQINPCTQYILQSATNMVLVSDLSLTGMRETLRFQSLLPTINASCQLILCANKAGEHHVGEISRVEFENAVSRQIDVVIPFDRRRVAAAMNFGRPIAADHGKVASALRELADQVNGTSSANKPMNTSLWRRMISK